MATTKAYEVGSLGRKLSVDSSGDFSFVGDLSVSGTITGSYAGFDSDFTAKSTSDLSEGSNLYYTTARFDSDFSTGGTFTSNVTFNDTIKANFGNGSDLQIYHDGAAGGSFIDENGVGNLSIRSVNGASVRLYSGGTASSNLRLLANSGGEVTLYHSGSAKLATTSTGIDVTGEVTADSATIPVLSGDVTFTGNLEGPSTWYIDPAPVDSDAGLLVIRGDLQVDGTTTTVNSTTVSINDKNIVLADSAANASEADGAGITVNGASATIAYDAANDEWDFNKTIAVSQSGYTANTTTANFGLYTGGSVDTTYVQMPASGQFQVWRPSTGAALTVDNEGNVGIGTSPDNADRLHIKDTQSSGVSIHLENNTYDAWINNWLSNGIRSNRFEINASQTGLDHIWLAANRITLGNDVGDGNEVLTSLGNNVGIGTTNPQTTLQVASTDKKKAPLVLQGPATNGMVLIGHHYLGNNEYYNTQGMDYSTNAWMIGSGVYVDSAESRKQLSTQDNYQARGASLYVDGSYGVIDFYTANNQIIRTKDTENTDITRRMRIAADGDIGIGTETPHTASGWNRSLHVHANGGVGSMIRFTDTASGTVEDGLLVGAYNTNAYIINRENGFMTFRTNNGGDHLAIRSNGYIGIGTTNPSKHLTIRQAQPFIRLEETSAGSKRLDLWVDSDSKAYIGANQSAQTLILQTVGQNRVVITSAGNVGIGTNSPTNSSNYNTLDIRGTTGGQIIAGSNTSQDFFMFTDTGGANIGSVNDIEIKAGTSGSMTSPNLHLDNDGSVGIGLTDPYKELDVNGDIALSQGNAHSTIEMSTSGALTIKANENTVNATAFIDFQMPLTAGSGALESKMTINHENIHVKEKLGVGISPSKNLHVNAGNVLINNSGGGTGKLTINSIPNTQTNGYYRANILMTRNEDQITWNSGQWDFAGGSSTDWSMIAHTSSGMKFFAGASQASASTKTNSQFDSDHLGLMIRTTGEVGVGTAPHSGSGLHVYTGDAGSFTPNGAHNDVIIEGSGNTGINIFSPNTSYQYLAFGDPQASNVGYVRYQHSINQMVLRAGSTDTVYVEPSLVGIGTNDPQQLLHVQGSLGINRGTGVPAANEGIIVDTSGTGDKTPIAIRTGASTSVPWSIIENGSTHDNAGPYGVLNLSRLNHSNDTSNKIEAGMFFEMKNTSGSIREFGGITAQRDGSNNRGALRFYTYDGSEQRDFKMTITHDGLVGVNTDTNLGAVVTAHAESNSNIGGTGNFALKHDNVNRSIHRLDSDGNYHMDMYGTGGWRNVAQYWATQKSISFKDKLVLDQPVATWSDSGTKFYTHLATGSFYNVTGAIIIDTNIPGDNQSSNGNMLSFRVTGYWYNNDSGGAIDAVFGVYCGENNHYNTTVTGTIPDAWRGAMYWGQNASGKLALRLGVYTTVQGCEIAVTDFVQGFSNVNTTYSEGWSTRSVTSATLTREDDIVYRNPDHLVISGIARTALSTSTDTFQVSNTGTFTPFSTLSRFKIDIFVNVNTSDDDSRGNQNPYRYGRIQRRVNGGTWTDADMLGISNQGGAASHIDMSPPRVGTASNTDTYMTQQDRYRTTAKTATIIDNPSYGMADNLQYRLMCYRSGGDSFIQIGEPHGYGTDDNYNAQPFGFVVTEIPWRE